MKKKSRIEIIDIAKAITIFLVIMGHSGSNLDTTMFRRVIYSFHMPLFFYLAGLSIKPRILKGMTEWIQFLRKNILALVFPYFIWGLIFGPFSFENILKLLYGSWNAIASTGTLSSLWYLVCLFVARIYVQLIFNLLEEKKNKEYLYLFCIVLMFVIGFMIPFRENGYPWCFDVAFVASAFILLGVVSRTGIIILSQQKLSILFVLLTVMVVVFSFGTIFKGDDLPLMLMCSGKYNDVFLFLLDAFSGSMIVMLISMIISLLSRESQRPFSTSLITYIGTHTMGIFLLHKNILQQLMVPLISQFISNKLLLSFVASAIVLIIVLLLCGVIEKYIPQLLGQFPPYEYGDKDTNK